MAPKIRVRITKASTSTLWYAKKIGEIFEVPKEVSGVSMAYGAYYGQPEGKFSGIYVNDCEIVGATE